MNSINEMELNDFKKAFSLFDKDNSGSISRQEIKEVFKEMKIRLTPDEIKKIMDNFDSNHDDSIQFDEFLLVLSAHLEDPQCQEWVLEVFQILDEDCDGLIKKHDLLIANQHYKLNIEERHLDLIIEQGDPYLQGGICYEEFVRIIRGK